MPPAGRGACEVREVPHTTMMREEPLPSQPDIAGSDGAAQPKGAASRVAAQAAAPAESSPRTRVAAKVRNFLNRKATAAMAPKQPKSTASTGGVAAANGGLDTPEMAALRTELAEEKQKRAHLRRTIEETEESAQSAISAANLKVQDVEARRMELAAELRAALECSKMFDAERAAAKQERDSLTENVAALERKVSELERALKEAPALPEGDAEAAEDPPPDPRVASAIAALEDLQGRVAAAMNCADDAARGADHACAGHEAVKLGVGRLASAASARIASLEEANAAMASSLRSHGSQADQLASALETVASLEASLSSAQAEAAEYQAKAAEAEGSVEMLRAQAAEEREAAAAAANAEVGAARAAQAAAEARASQAETALGALEVRMSEEAGRAQEAFDEKATHAVAEAAAKQAELRERLDASEAAAAEAAASHATALADAEAKVSQAELDATALRDRVEAIEAARSQEASALTRAEARASESEASLSAMAERLRAMEAAQEEAASSQAKERTALEIKAEAAKASANALAARAEAAESESKALAHELASLEKDAAAAKEASGAEHAKLIAQLEAAEASQGAAESQAASLAAQLKEAREATEAQQQAAGAERALLAEELEAADAARGVAQEEAAALTAQLEASRKDAEDAKEASEAELAKLSEQLEAATRELSLLRGKGEQRAEAERQRGDDLGREVRTLLGEKEALEARLAAADQERTILSDLLRAVQSHQARPPPGGGGFFNRLKLATKATTKAPRPVEPPSAAEEAPPRQPEANKA